MINRMVWRLLLSAFVISLQCISHLDANMVDDNQRLYLTADQYYKSRQNKRSGIYQRDSTDNLAEAPPAPDSLPLVAAFRRTKDSMNAVFDANRVSGVEPYEGDMILDKIDSDKIKRSMGKNHVANKKNSVRERRKLWISKVIPYEMDPSRMGAEPAVRKAMDAIEAVSCLKFRKKVASDQNWIRVFMGIGCYSDIGRKFFQKSPTNLSLGKLCLQQGTITHELMHALGFFHEQSRPDRNSFIVVNFENVRKGMEEQFEIHGSYEADTGDTDYDVHSIMHYGNTAFNVNGQDTMDSIFDEAMQLGGRNLSATDIVRLNKLYSCQATGKTYSAWSDWSPCREPFTRLRGPKKCTRTRQRFCFLEDKTKCPKADEYGVEGDEEDCKLAICKEPVHGHWGTWSEWTSCTKKCDEGTHTRERKCDNPKPIYKGKPCKGKLKQTKPCKIKPCIATKYDTNFEDGWDMWEQGTKDDFDWQRQSSGTPTLRTGPKRDHTFGSGFYAYVEGSPPRLPGDIARLISAEFNGNPSVQCMTFYYMMKGKDIGYLDLHVKTTSGSLINIWHKNGHQGPDWYNGAGNIPILKEKFRLVFEASIGNGELSDIALDDIFYLSGRCPLTEQGCEDHNPMCKDWASQDECQNNKEWMNKACCKSCTERGSCKDRPSKGFSKKDCKTWALKNECLSNEKWMWKNCCRSCQRCLDSSPFCLKWKKQGQCKLNRFWMENNCRTSCGICSAKIPMKT